MAYYPKSQIKTNLYTNGEEYLLSTTGKYYKGYFYEVSNGDRFTGKTPQDLPSILLTVSSEINKLPQDETSPNITLISGTPNYNSIVVEPRSIPIPNLTLPTSQDYKFGEFQRYFAKKNNELRYLEIDKQTYTLLQNRDTAIAWDLYTPITVTWELSGNKEKTYNINKNMVNLVERNNKWYGFTQWFKDKFLKYYQNLTPQENLYTSGKEFKTPNGREYIGLYHIHPKNGAMVGATHIKKKHDFLTPINSTILSPLTSSQSPPNTSSSPSNGGGGY
jgi:hypothetical protein